MLPYSFFSCARTQEHKYLILIARFNGRYERRYGKTADGYLCVTKAMQHELKQNWGIQ